MLETEMALAANGGQRDEETYKQEIMEYVISKGIDSSNLENQELYGLKY